MPFKPFETKMTEQQVIDGLKSTFGNEFTTPDVRAFCAMNDISYNTVTRKIKKFRVKPGKWSLKVTSKRVRQIEKSYSAPAVEPKPQQNLIPEVDDTFVKFGSFNDLKKIVSSKLFYPTFITGLSGNGKTFGVEQVCAQLGRELIRVNITIETDEDDLIGGFRLVNGETLKPSNEVQYCSLTKSTLPLTKFSAFRASLREMEFSLRKLADSLDPPTDSTYSPPQILRVKVQLRVEVQTMDDLLELTCSTKPSSSDSQLPSSKTTPLPQ